MTRVSQEHRDGRRRQILDGARRCFLAKGFRTASMQDVAADIGLSTGAVYSYFAGKDELIAEVAAEAAEQVGRSVVAAAAAAPFPTLDELLDRILAAPPLNREGDGAARLLVQVWSECLLNPGLTARLRSSWADMVEELSGYGQELRSHGVLAGDAAAEALARAVIGILQGLLLQQALLGPSGGEAFREGLRDFTSATPRA
ncbi:TetR/AcrR family transcriptional regulator [Kitasatospora sp. NPDC056138]|uniref:TetR/AcrR family transcriptional regulator n=1 Tax=Kitasatospora sp. NPDC056138 TaxID=3345724 RepID=UPI0035D813C8